MVVLRGATESRGIPPQSDIPPLPCSCPNRHGKSQLYFLCTLSVLLTGQQKQALGELGEEIWTVWVGKLVGRD